MANFKKMYLISSEKLYAMNYLTGNKSNQNNKDKITNHTLEDTEPGTTSSTKSYTSNNIIPEDTIEQGNSSGIIDLKNNDNDNNTTTNTTTTTAGTTENNYINSNNINNNNNNINSDNNINIDNNNNIINNDNDNNNNDDNDNNNNNNDDNNNNDNNNNNNNDISNINSDFISCYCNQKSYKPKPIKIKNSQSIINNTLLKRKGKVKKVVKKKDRTGGNKKLNEEHSKRNKSIKQTLITDHNISKISEVTGNRSLKRKYTPLEDEISNIEKKRQKMSAFKNIIPYNRNVNKITRTELRYKNRTRPSTKKWLSL